MLKRLLRERRGATAIEYGLITAMIALSMMASITGYLGPQVTGQFQEVTAAVDPLRYF